MADLRERDSTYSPGYFHVFHSMLMVPPAARRGPQRDTWLMPGVQELPSSVHVTIPGPENMIGLYPPVFSEVQFPQFPVFPPRLPFVNNSINNYSSPHNLPVPRLNHNNDVQLRTFRLEQDNRFVPTEPVGAPQFVHQTSNIPPASNLSNNRIPLPAAPTAVEPETNSPALSEGTSAGQMRRRAEEILAALVHGEASSSNPGEENALTPRIITPASSRFGNQRQFQKRISTLRRLCRKTANKAYFSNDKIQVRQVASIISAANPWIQDFAPNEPGEGEIFRRWVNSHRERGADWRDEFHITSEMIEELRRWNLVIKKWSTDVYRARWSKSGPRTNKYNINVGKPQKAEYDLGSESSTENNLPSEVSNVTSGPNNLDESISPNSEIEYQEGDAQPNRSQEVHGDIIDISEESHSPFESSDYHEIVSLPLFEISNPSDTSNRTSNNEPVVSLITIWGVNAKITSWEESDYEQTAHNQRRIPLYCTENLDPRINGTHNAISSGGAGSYNIGDEFLRIAQPVELRPMAMYGEVEFQPIW